MAQYSYKVKRGAEEVQTGVMEGDSQRSVVARLRDMGLSPISVDPVKAEVKPGARRGALSRIRLKDRNIFFRQLATLLQAGMPLLRALSTVEAQAPNPKLAAVIADLRGSVQKGSSFAEALEAHPQVFPSMYTNMVHAGETGGMLEDVLWRLVLFGEKDEDLRGKAFSAMVYPVFLIVIGSIAIFILVSFVFPNFVTVFEDFDARLPWPTVAVMAVCEFMGRFWWAALAVFAGCVAAFMAYRRSAVGRRQLDRAYLRLPVIGDLIRRYEMAKFARTLGTLFDNGVPVLTALRITGDTLSNTFIREEVDVVHAQVTDGASISQSLGQTTQFPPLVVSMFSVGEESGRLGETTQRIADAYDVEVDRAVKTMTSLMEPVLIVVMGVIIGFLVISMLLPMLTLSVHVR